MKQHELELAVQRVRELHNPVQLDPEWGEHCEQCDQDFPCETIKALDGEWNPLDHPVSRPEEK
jgi:hypothetical protein